MKREKEIENKFKNKDVLDGLSNLQYLIIDTSKFQEKPAAKLDKKLDKKFN